MQDHTIFRDLDHLQSIYSSTFNESSDHTSYKGYLQRCKERRIPQSAIMSEEEWEAMQSGDMHPHSDIRDEEWYKSDKPRVYRYDRNLRKEDEESYLAPKTKMTEEEAMDWFSNSDNFHQLFHKFMQQQKYVEKEVNGKQFWIKSK